MKQKIISIRLLILCISIFHHLLIYFAILLFRLKRLPPSLFIKFCFINFYKKFWYYLISLVW